MDAHADAAALSDFTRFFDAEFPYVVRSITPIANHAAEDVAQEAFVVALRQWERVRTLDAPHAWVRLVAKRLALRTRGREVERSRREGLLDADVEIETAISDRMDVARALADLPERQRVAVRLHYQADLPVAAVASVLGATEIATRVTLHRARAGLAGTLLGIPGIWTTQVPWQVDDLVAAVRAIGAEEHLDVLRSELPLGDGRWTISFRSGRYWIGTDAGERLDEGVWRIRGRGLELTPWNSSGDVSIASSIDGRRARLRVRADTTAPTRGVPDDVFLRLILDRRDLVRVEM